MATTPTTRLASAASRNDETMPYRPISTNPAMIVPKIAPVVLAPYNTLTRSPSRSVRVSDDFITSGRLAPISVAGTISAANASTNRTPVSSRRESGATSATAT